MTNFRVTFAIVIVAALFHDSSLMAASAQARSSAPAQPNILFIILDDWGIDQAKSFSYGGIIPPRVPTLDTLAESGMKFRNVWAMPECSPSRVAMFTGRYPLRTGVPTALVTEDLANSQMSFFEATTPKILRAAGYTSGLFGKYHLGGPDNNPFGQLAPGYEGWDRFDGSLFASPPAIDTTAGGVAELVDEETSFSCGFDNSIHPGACYFEDETCSEMLPTAEHPIPGRQCMEEGGIFVRQHSCIGPRPEQVNFAKQNAYYVWPHTIVDATDYNNGTADSPELLTQLGQNMRQYGTVQLTDAAIEWINEKQENPQPWMATISYNAIHTPYQQAPDALLPNSNRLGNSLINCAGPAGQAILGNQMAEAMDQEIGRLLVETGIAGRDHKGNLDYDPSSSDTMIVWVGDNGTFFPSVKQPFDRVHAKGTPYQTGVWVAMAVTGPLLHPGNRGRSVDHMLNVADLFELWGEIAGVDVRNEVPDAHILDSQPVLPYLTKPRQRSIRETNFSQIGQSLKPADVGLGPCVIDLGPQQACTDILFTFDINDDGSSDGLPGAGFCVQEGGEWFGPTSDSSGLGSCCEVKMQPGNEDLIIVPKAAWTVRNKNYKLTRFQRQDEDDCNSSQLDTTWEFYPVNERKRRPLLDGPDENLLALGSLSKKEKNNCDALFAEMEALLNSEVGDHIAVNNQVYCLGDGNLDKVVNADDAACVDDFANNASGGSVSGMSSWCDMNFDGLTNSDDQAIVATHMGKDCRVNPTTFFNDDSPCE